MTIDTLRAVMKLYESERITRDEIFLIFFFNYELVAHPNHDVDRLEAHK